MTDFIVTVHCTPVKPFDRGIIRFRQPAVNEEHAKRQVMEHSLFPVDGTIVRVKEAAFKKITH
jgi:hypothetical protein